MKARKNPAAPGTGKRVLTLLMPYRLLILSSILLSAGAVALTLYLPVLVGRAIDCIVGVDRVDFDAIKRLLLRIAVCAGLTAVMQWLVSVIHNRVSYQVIRDVRNRTFQHLQQLR